MAVIVRFIIGFVLLIPGSAFGLDPVGEEQIARGLSQSLSAFKTSVDQLSYSNKTVASRNLQLKDRLDALRVNVEKLKNENEELARSKAKLEEEIPAKSAQIQVLDKKVAGLDASLKTFQEQINTAQANNEKALEEEKGLNNQIAGTDEFAVPGSMEGEMSEMRHQRNKEKLALLKVISQVQEREALLQEQIEDFQKDHIVKNSQKEELAQQVKHLEREIADLASIQNKQAPTWDEDQFNQLEQNVVTLEQNRLELENLVSKIQKKAESVDLDSTDKQEQEKLKANIDKLQAETKVLQIDLEEMQQQMVLLDKRKSQLEALFIK